MVSGFHTDIPLTNENQYALNPKCSVCVSYVGEEQSPVVIIDNFWLHPQQLTALAADVSQGQFTSSDDEVDPAVSKPFPSDLLVRFKFEIALLLRQHMTRPANRIDTHFSAFAMPASPASISTSSSSWRTPHIDSVTKHEFAMVCYLFTQPSGGTSFYRHRQTGFEVINEARQIQYQQVLKVQAAEQERSDLQVTHTEMNGFERVHSVSAWFNRAVLYPANLLHCDDLPEVQPSADSLACDPHAGRLTFRAGLRLSP